MVELRGHLAAAKNLKLPSRWGGSPLRTACPKEYTRATANGTARLTKTLHPRPYDDGRGFLGRTTAPALSRGFLDEGRPTIRCRATTKRTDPSTFGFRRGSIGALTIRHLRQVAGQGRHQCRFSSDTITSEQQLVIPQGGAFAEPGCSRSLRLEKQNRRGCAIFATLLAAPAALTIRAALGGVSNDGDVNAITLRARAP